jgi:hypothetical protein
VKVCSIRHCGTERLNAFPPQTYLWAYNVVALCFPRVIEMLRRSLTIGIAVMAACQLLPAAGAVETASAPLPGMPKPVAAVPALAVPVLPDQAERLATMLGALDAEGWNSGDLTIVSGPHAGQSVMSHLEALREFRCKTSISKWFQRGQRRCYATVYIFDGPVGAYGAYTALRKGATTVVTRGDGSSEDDQSISFWQGDCYVNLYTTAEDDDEAKDLLRSVADRVASAIQTHAPVPRIVTGLPQLDRVNGSEKVIMGPVVARQQFPAPYVSLLMIDKSLAAASADYQFGQPTRERLKLLVVDYGNKPLAQSIYNQYVLNLEASHDGQTSDTQSLFKLQGTYMLCQLRGNRMAIITGARRRGSPMMLARQISNPE